MDFSTSNMLSFTNPASPLSPLNPLNPLNPASPLNPLNLDSGDPAPPVDKFALRNEQFQDDLKKVAPGGDWMSGKGVENVARPGVGSLTKTADGFTLEVVRQGWFGPTRELSYVFDRSQQTVEVKEESLTGPVRNFFSGREPHEHYILNLDKGTCKEV